MDFGTVLVGDDGTGSGASVGAQDHALVVQGTHNGGAGLGEAWHGHALDAFKVRITTRCVYVLVLPSIGTANNCPN